MVTVKLLKPYYIKMNSEYIRVILAYQYFSLIINKKIYHFIPIEGQEILVNRKTKQVVNTETKFAFQNGKDIVYLTMKKLTTLDDFVNQLDDIIKPYYDYKSTKKNRIEEKVNDQTMLIVSQLEKQNIIRLIDQALDEKDEEMFRYLTKLL